MRWFNPLAMYTLIAPAKHCLDRPNARSSDRAGNEVLAFSKRARSWKRWIQPRLAVRILSVREPWLDTAGPVRSLLVAIFGRVAEQERTRLIERTKAGLERADVKVKDSAILRAR
jgi:hypothetical protein